MKRGRCKGSERVEQRRGSERVEQRRGSERGRTLSGKEVHEQPAVRKKGERVRERSREGR